MLDKKLLLTVLTVFLVLTLGLSTTYSQTIWTKYPYNPVLDLGPSGSWDAVAVANLSVLLDGTTYKMWYSGYDRSDWRIGKDYGGIFNMATLSSSTPDSDSTNNTSQVIMDIVTSTDLVMKKIVTKLFTRAY